ncbi:hypothetical protein HanRHA438_Chr09g0382111 [Helianthus annuus]|uniref:Uncharacterized protein n=1 Tax=Helianthus annuus TaxID=4232 RepID=A0A9K3I3G6_HELAN|nr:hypothetical protein HanXRQr2_Chr09g0370501 [Helianthus annuus]KAJ0532695.1 hypothetical protein HanIR_Chr09g0399841 [Helianthus annuus]KAJ0886670.1 hypothetical protein HanRHA438_Chr09g0382111 [Helianthus annuus]KAJ0891684.1 hypothetical protein HanPSC8_Chr09g0356931 [Helianthus annuus]
MHLLLIRSISISRSLNHFYTIDIEGSFILVQQPLILILLKSSYGCLVEEDRMLCTGYLI